MLMSTRNFWTLSEVLSWIAFGLRVERKELKSELMGASFGYPYLDAKALIGLRLEDLMNAVHAGQVEAQGRFHKNADNRDGASTRSFESVEALDYRAFDIFCDGLRYGKGLLWLPEKVNDETHYVHRPLLRSEHFSDVVISFADLTHAGLKRGTSPKSKQASKQHISRAVVAGWFNALSEQEQLRSQEDLWSACRHAFPGHNVPRIYIREITAGRKPGRPSSR
jgi:hypothetical protein